MTCCQTAHILDLYDNFREAEIAYARFLDWEIDLADKVSKRKCAKYTEAEDEKHKLEYEIVMLAKEAARVAMMDIGLSAKRGCCSHDGGCESNHVHLGLGGAGRD